MSKGASQQGTQNIVNPNQAAQLPYLAGGWEAAQNLYDVNQQPYQGQTLAEWGRPEQIAGYQNLYNAGANNQQIQQAALNPFNQATGGQYGVQSSPAFGGLSDIGADATRGQQALIGNQAALTDIGNQAINLGNYNNAALTNTGLAAGGAGNYQAGSLQGIGQQAAGAGQAYSGQLQGTGQQAGGTGNYYAGQLGAQAGLVPGMTAPAQQQLGYNAATAGARNPANPYLQQQASGAYLNSNPYLDQMYDAAADATTRAYQTATAPRTESSFELAGRYGSPSARNATSQNEQNLGSTLGDLSANIYGTQYQNERALQNQATEALGSQYLSGLGQSTQAAQAQGQLGLGTGELQQQGFNLAGQQALQGLQQQAAAQQAGGTLGLQGLQQQTAAQQAASNAQLQGLQQQAAAQQAGGNLGLAGLGAAGTANTAAGQLNLSDTQAINTALGTMQQGYQTGNQQALSAAGMAPALQQAAATNAQMQTQAGQGLAGIEQAQLNDQVARYNAAVQSPVTNLNTYLAQIGQPTQASGSTSTPIYGSPTGQALSTVGGLNSMFGNPLSTLGSSALGGLGLGSAAPIGAQAVAAGAPAVLAPGLTSAGLSSLAAMNTGATAASMAPLAAGAWIVCTELRRQGRMKPEHWRAGVRVFDRYPELGKRGYWVWAIPLVRHLRKHPDSLLSRVAGTVFRWRAEDLAARAGVKGARKLMRGRAVTAALWVPCLALGVLVGKQDWRSVYRGEETCR